jgi:hypothetical protein
LKTYRIVEMAEVYALVDMSTDEVVRTHEEPETLSKWALWENDARLVRHDYDLRGAEDARHARWKAAGL